MVTLCACGLLALTSLAAAPVSAQAAPPDPLQLPRFEVAPTIDGVVDEPVWQTAATIEDFVETWPGDNVPPPRRTRVRLGVDATNLYVAIEADDEPGAVRATLARRDDVLADDHLRLLLDTFDDRRHAYVLALNPFGIAQDGDPGPGRTLDVSLQVDWRPTDALRLTADLSRSTLTREDTRLLAYDQRLATARVTYQLTRALFARLRGSYDSLAGTSLGEALFAWTPSPGTAVYVGYEEPASRDPRRFGRSRARDAAPSR
jgi:hypothetical protein